MKTKKMQLYLTGLLMLVAGMFVANTMAAERITYVHFDAQGSPLAGSDRDGKLVWREEYTPYGDTVDGAETTGSIGFAGKLHDPDIGLSYFGARWYDPVTGRFMGVDPADFYQENIHSFNRYTYANNNPYAYVDPDGNLPILLVAYGIYKAASIAYDAYTTYQTVSDSSASTTEKVVAVASLAAGAVDPTGAANKLRSLAKLSKATKSVSKSVAKEPNRIYSARELKRRAENPRTNNAENPNHNFPESFNSEIFKGNKTIVSDKYHLYTKPGTLNGRSGVYEIGVKPSASGKTEVITHRFFNPSKK